MAERCLTYPFLSRSWRQRHLVLCSYYLPEPWSYRTCHPTSRNWCCWYCVSIFVTMDDGRYSDGGVRMFLATIPAVLWVDQLGRKPVLISGAFLMGA